MANLKFYGADNSESDNTELYCMADESLIYITLDDGKDPYQFVYLDIPTAISFRKHLAQQIAKAKEVQNG